MLDDKITVELLRNYLGGNGLYCFLDYGKESYFDALIGINADGSLLFENDQGDTHTIESVKPLCRKLENLHNYYPDKSKSLGDQLGFNSAPEHLKSNILAIVSGNMRYHHYQTLWKHHFWTGPQDFFEKGFVLDKSEYSWKEAPNA